MLDARRIFFAHDLSRQERFDALRRFSEASSSHYTQLQASSWVNRHCVAFDRHFQPPNRGVFVVPHDFRLPELLVYMKAFAGDDPRMPWIFLDLAYTAAQEPIRILDPPEFDLQSLKPVPVKDSQTGLLIVQAPFDRQRYEVATGWL